MGSLYEIAQMYQQFRQNPLSFLTRKYNIPGGLSDPQAIIQHLLNSGQITQTQLNEVVKLRNTATFKNLF